MLWKSVYKKCGKTVKFTYNRIQRPREGVEVYLYSFFNLGARWGWVVKTTLQPCNFGKESRYSFYRGVGGPQARSENTKSMASV